MTTIRIEYKDQQVRDALNKLLRARYSRTE